MTAATHREAAAGLARQHELIRQAAYEIESLGVMMQRTYGRCDAEDLWLRGVAARLEVLAGVAMRCADDDLVDGDEFTQIQGRVFGPDWERRNRSAT